MTAAERCRRNGWVVGTRLRGRQYEDLIVMEITSIGAETVGARLVSLNGIPYKRTPIIWPLDARQWRRVR